jgi:hypothetical protein
VVLTYVDASVAGDAGGGESMRRLILVSGATLVLTVAASLTVVGLGETEVTLSCDDGTSLTLVVDAQQLIGLTQTVQAMIDYPSGLTCGLTQTPVAAPILGLRAIAGDGPKDMALQGGQWGTPGCVVNLSFMAWKDVSGQFRGTVNQSVPGGQPCFVGLEGHFRATIDVCFSVGTSATAQNEGVLVGHVEHANGPFYSFLNGGEDYYAYAEDIGNPQAGISPDRFWSDFTTHSCTHPYGGLTDQLLNGNNNVKDSPSVAP